jgi:hypothetical protein
MKAMSVTFVALTLAGGGLIKSCTQPPQSEAVWVVSDEPCGPGQSATVPAGSDYINGVWFDPDGVSIGWSTVEDGCINVATDDLAVQS